MSKADKMLPKQKNTAALPPRGGLSNLMERAANLIVRTKSPKLVDVPTPPIVVAPALVPEPTAAHAVAGGKPSEARKAAAKRREAGKRERTPGLYAVETWLRALRMREACGIGTGWLASRLAGGVCEATGMAFDVKTAGSPWAPVVVRRDASGEWSEANCWLVCAWYAGVAGFGWRVTMQAALAIVQREGLDA